MRVKLTCRTGRMTKDSSGLNSLWQTSRAKGLMPPTLPEVLCCQKRQGRSSEFCGFAFQVQHRRQPSWRDGAAGVTEQVIGLLHRPARCGSVFRMRKVISGRESPNQRGQSICAPCSL